VERLLKLHRTAAIYFISGIGGVLYGCLFNDDINVGSSSGLYGVCGSFVFLILDIIDWMANH